MFIKNFFTTVLTISLIGDFVMKNKVSSIEILKFYQQETGNKSTNEFNCPEEGIFVDNKRNDTFYLCMNLNNQSHMLGGKYDYNKLISNLNKTQGKGHNFLMNSLIENFGCNQKLMSSANGEKSAKYDQPEHKEVHKALKRCHRRSLHRNSEVRMMKEKPRGAGPGSALCANVNLPKDIVPDNGTGFLAKKNFSSNDSAITETRRFYDFNDYEMLKNREAYLTTSAISLLSEYSFVNQTDAGNLESEVYEPSVIKIVINRRGSGMNRKRKSVMRDYINNNQFKKLNKRILDAYEQNDPGSSSTATSGQTTEKEEEEKCPVVQYLPTFKMTTCKEDTTVEYNPCGPCAPGPCIAVDSSGKHLGIVGNETVKQRTNSEIRGKVRTKSVRNSQDFKKNNQLKSKKVSIWAGRNFFINDE